MAPRAKSLWVYVIPDLAWSRCHGTNCCNNLPVAIINGGRRRNGHRFASITSLIPRDLSVNKPRHGNAGQYFCFSALRCGKFGLFHTHTDVCYRRRSYSHFSASGLHNFLQFLFQSYSINVFNRNFWTAYCSVSCCKQLFTSNRNTKYSLMNHTCKLNHIGFHFVFK